MIGHLAGKSKVPAYRKQNPLISREFAPEPPIRQYIFPEIVSGPLYFRKAKNLDLLLCPAVFAVEINRVHID